MHCLLKLKWRHITKTLRLWDWLISRFGMSHLICLLTRSHLFNFEVTYSTDTNSIPPGCVHHRLSQLVTLQRRLVNPLVKSPPGSWIRGRWQPTNSLHFRDNIGDQNNPASSPSTIIRSFPRVLSARIQPNIRRKANYKTIITGSSFTGHTGRNRHKVRSAGDA